MVKLDALPTWYKLLKSVNVWVFEFVYFCHFLLLKTPYINPSSQHYHHYYAVSNRFSLVHVNIVRAALFFSSSMFSKQHNTKLCLILRGVISNTLTQICLLTIFWPGGCIWVKLFPPLALCGLRPALFSSALDKYNFRQQKRAEGRQNSARVSCKSCKSLVSVFCVNELCPLNHVALIIF